MIGSLRRSVASGPSMVRIVRMFGGLATKPSFDLKTRLATISSNKEVLQTTISQGFIKELELYSNFIKKSSQSGSDIEVAELEKFYLALLDKDIVIHPKSDLGVLIALNILSEINPNSSEQESLAENFLAPLSEEEWNFESLEQRVRVLHHLINYFSQVPQNLFHFLDKQIKTHLYNPRLRSDPHQVLTVLGPITDIHQALLARGKQGLPASILVLKELVDTFVKQQITPRDWNIKKNIAMLALSVRDDRLAANTPLILGELEGRLSSEEGSEIANQLSNNDLILVECSY